MSLKIHFISIKCQIILTIKAQSVYLRSASFNNRHFPCLKAPRAPPRQPDVIPAITSTWCEVDHYVSASAPVSGSSSARVAGVRPPSCFYKANPPASICWLDSSQEGLPVLWRRHAAIRWTDCTLTRYRGKDFTPASLKSSPFDNVFVAINS